jgi:UDP-N-acetylmuramoyl-L-alanyl-D-glutamate--2,6-diaminopimelate ligase
MKLRDLISGLAIEQLGGGDDVEISDLAYDNRAVVPGALFFCVSGMTRDGHEFAADAVARGAAALIVERPLEVEAPQVQVADARAAMAALAARFFDEPTRNLELVGITGTNGKTTTAFFLRAILEADGRQAGMLGTVKRIVGGVEEDVERTTPEAIDLQRTFRRMLDAGDRACVMEVSSHALALHRTDGLDFDCALFTNLTQDHLDFHSDMEDYFESKRLLFSAGPRRAAINLDDDYGRRLAGEFDCLTYSAEGAEGADLRAVDVAFDAGGSRFRVIGPEGEEAEIAIALPGHFNVANALAAFAVARALGVPAQTAVGALAAAGGVPGRFEPVEAGQPFTVLVDYAHTPNSLENVLRAARVLTSKRLIVVFGCGGARDREKRPLMGKIGAELADLCIVTSDNPRSEDPKAIIAEILAGAGGDVEVEPDRRAAIAQAMASAAEGDVVVIAGKGHEQGQEFDGGRKVPFDDREVAREELERVATRAAP